MSSGGSEKSRILEILSLNIELFHLKVILYGDIETLDHPENVVYICNHQSTMDWVIADMMAIRGGRLGNLRFILKDGLKYLPLFGYVLGTVRSGYF